MFRDPRRDWSLFWVTLVVLGAGCGDRTPATPSLDPGRSIPSAPSSPDSIPADHLGALMAAHYRGLGAMERYEYAAAARAFREVHDLAPGWTIGTINLAIALLNQGGEEAEKATKSGEATAEQESLLNIEAARRLLDEVIEAHPDQPFARFSRGIILRSQGRLVAAHRDFARVAEIDPHDAHNWLEYGATITDPNQENMPAGRPQAAELIAAYTKALEANPYLVTAMFKLQFAYNQAGDRARQRELYARFESLNPKKHAAAAGEVAATIYGEMGRYAQVIDPFPRTPGPQPPLVSPRFDPARSIEIALATGDRWAEAADFAGPNAALGRARDRFGAGVATFDVNRDGLLDLYLTAAIVGPQGLRDALLINRGAGRFEDRTAAYRLPLDRAGLGVAAADFDADFKIDLYLTGIDDNRLLRQTDHEFEDVTARAGVSVANAVSLTARWFDLDQDGDLDLFVVNHATAETQDQLFTEGAGSPGMPNLAFRNDGRPAPVGMRPEDNWAPLATATADLAATAGLSLAFSTHWPGAEVLQGGAGRSTSFAALDIDNDRDFDYVITADGQPPRLILNDRAGRFHEGSLVGWPADGFDTQLLAADLDKDGRTDLVATNRNGRAIVWRNETDRSASSPRIQGQVWPANARQWRAATVADLDLDSWNDLVGLPGPDPSRALEWSRNLGTKLENRPLALGPIGDDVRPVDGFVVADLVGDPLPDLLLWRSGEAPRIAPNLGNGQHWLAIDLSGRWKTSFDQMRTNSEGIGAHLSLEGAGIFNPITNASLVAGTAQSNQPLVLGLGAQLTAPLLRARWPDGVMQAELNVTADKTLKLTELNRKTGSCPVLFTWNNERFVCLGDFAGAAGLGFLEAPGEYHVPDRDEALAISSDQLSAVDGVYRLSVVEPMDEIAYLDRLDLEVVDLPPTIQTTPDERFAFGDDQPSGEPVLWTRAIRPLAATDHRGHDVLPLLASADRRSVAEFDRVRGWVGYTEPHSITLDFGDQLAHLAPGEEPVLCLTGWVEYPYSQTNYAAASSGLILQPPVLEQRVANGQWRVIAPQMGHPAGLTRRMTFNLTGKWQPGPATFRITTNMECYWDEAFVALHQPELAAQIERTNLPVARARLRERGYLHESAPDGLKPALPDYQGIEAAPLARLRGLLTRLGDVASLVEADDDHLCVMGPGDEVQLEFDCSDLATLKPGWTRSFVFRSVAYCKDADPFTATSDSVEPLPWRAMPAFPFPTGLERPRDQAYQDYLREFQTRPAGER